MVGKPPTRASDSDAFLQKILNMAYEGFEGNAIEHHRPSLLAISKMRALCVELQNRGFNVKMPKTSPWLDDTE